MGKVTDNDIKRYAGDTYPERATLKINGDPLDLTDKTVKMYIYEDQDNPIQITGTVTDAAGGKVEFPMALASALDPSRYTYEVKVDDGSYITTFAKAIMEIV